MTDTNLFKLPDVGEGLTEAEIVKWHVQPGDTVEINQTIVEIETAKAIVELPCPFEGVVAELLVSEGETVDVGTPIIAVGAAGGAVATPVSEPPAQAAALSETDAVPTADEPGMTAPDKPKRTPVLVGYGVKEGTTRRRPRKATAAAMTDSAFTAPHVTEFLQVDVTRTMEAVKRIRELPEFADVKVSPLLLVARALLTAVARHPMVNATWEDAPSGAEIVVKRYVNLGIAAATDRGLIVPKIKEAQDLDLPGLARALNDLAAKARAGKASPADLSDGTITITNVGVFGVDTGTPIITPGEAAILAFGQIRDMPWVHEGELAVRKVTTLALSFDHRMVDGELGSRVLRDVGDMLEDPLRMLAWS
nr:dihydrolipoamide acetyltransferase family protein [Actinomadura sp. WAC 06369]